MSDCMHIDRRFGEIAVTKNFVPQAKLDRALVVQRCIFDRTNVHMPIGKVLKEMGLLTEAQVEIILEAQRNGSANASPEAQETQPDSCNTFSGLDLVVSDDKLAAYVSPSGDNLNGVTVESVKMLLMEKGIVEGVVADELLAAFLAERPLPAEPFQVAGGRPAQPGEPPRIQYHFDTDPMRIGTLNSDGTMDWKNRGEVPYTKSGDLLAEKIGGRPGTPGMTIYGKELTPPRVKEPQLKSGKGAQRSEDRRQILAKIDGTPKLGTDGRISVFALLPVDGDIGIETGHLDFDGYIEASGGVCAGYTVKSRGLRTREIQNATVEVQEDLVSFGGIYGSSIVVGGNLKASHIHNSTVDVTGDVVVEKEIFNCTIETSGRCIIGDGKIIASKISAKKGIQVRDIGTEAARPSELRVGFDHKYARDMQNLKDELAELDRQTADVTTSQHNLRTRSDDLNVELGQIAQEQDGYMVQKRRLEEKLKSIPADDEGGRRMLAELIEELANRSAAIDERVNAIMTEDDQIRSQVSNYDKALKQIQTEIAKTKESMAILEESLRCDPGIAVLKVSGTVCTKTSVEGLHKKIIIPQDMQLVRIGEAKSEYGTNQWQMKISSLR